MSDRRLKVAYISIGCNLALVVIKLFGASLSNSVAMKADAIHSMSDIFVSALVLLGILLSKEHPRWLKTVENSVALLISSLIMGAAVALLVKTLQYRDYTLERVPLVIGFVWVCILISYAVARYKIRVGRETDSPSLEADGYHSMMDMYSSVAVLIGLVGSLVGLRLDALASVVVVLLIFKVGLEVMVGSIQGLGKSEVFTFETTAFLRSTSFGAKVSTFFEELSARLPGGGHDLISDAAQTIWRRRRTVAWAAAVSALIAYGVSGFYRIQPDEVGVVLLCGKLTEDKAPPGLHYRLPSPIAKLHRVKPNMVRQLEFGFRTIAARGEVSEPDAYLWESRHRSGIYEKVEPEAIMLTGDKNEVDLNLAIEYRVSPDAAAAFLFNLADSESVVRAATESCTRAVAGTMYLNDALTTARQPIERRIKTDLQRLLDAYDTGVQITALCLQDVHPPVAVVPSFRQVASARENKVTKINQALAYQMETVPKARGLGKYILADADAHRTEKKLNAEGDALYFNAMVEAYSDAPEAVAFVKYMDSLEEVLPPLRKVILSREVSADPTKNLLGKFFLAGEFLKKAFQSYGTPRTEMYSPEEDVQFYKETEEERP